MGQRIASSASAYLRQHAHQPVDWWPYGDAAFEHAKARNIPVFLSIGYAACHWCHVMAAESFDDPQVAGYLNENFVPIKVDREEHPTVDQTYMAATQTLTGSGGWPMSVFTLPDGRTIHAGTYFPPKPHPGQPSFSQVLEAVHDAWVNRRPQLEEQATALATHLGSVATGQAKMFSRKLPLPTSENQVRLGPVIATAIEKLGSLEDPTGAFGPAPKFPPSPVLDFLLRAGLGTGPAATAATTLANRTLNLMATGALADQIEGGFARYCVDAQWKIPHFEKMLYDNAQLLSIYARAAVQSPRAVERELFSRAARGIGNWLRARMLLPSGGLASSLDADTVMEDGSHREGATYTFTRSEIEEIITDKTNAFWELWDGRAAEVSDGQEPSLSIALGKVPNLEQWAELDLAFEKLATVRQQRIQPARDEKVVAGWNGLAIAALAEASVLLDEPEFLELATGAAEYLWATHWDAKRSVLLRVSYQGQADLQNIGVLEDHASVVLGFQALAVIGGEQRWLERSHELLDGTVERFVSAAGPVDAPSGDPRVLASRAGALTAEALDDAVPAASSLLAAALLARAGMRQIMESGFAGQGNEAINADLELVRTLIGFVPAIADRAPHAAGSALGVAVKFVRGSTSELVIAGGRTEQRHEAMRLGVLAGIAQLGNLAAPVSLATNYPTGPAEGLRIYVCRGGVCHMPANSPAELIQLLVPGLENLEAMH
ncbi:thioredoxin domain-containing protein [Arthrobacter sp. MYb227]|uniref:thioredoxin domain-containing protein n=1 Tax=Arthrobacter sp. MYb227 TaxID=1848601 RepID=UPI000CFCBCE4|nr:thioredoxin domain-containing protein [Arthrobacter sp. MYb227]PQZ91037.1 thioredoxin domain-containing protein [Arthrobacter sp. MYb227]